MYPFGYNVKESNDEIFIRVQFSEVILQIHKCRLTQNIFYDAYLKLNQII